MAIRIATRQGELALINDLDRPALPTDFRDYRDLLVIDPHGEDIGRIVDVLVNLEDRKPVMAVVLFGGFLDMGAKHILLPYEWLSDPTGNSVRTTISRETAGRSPDFDPRLTTQFDPYLSYWNPEDAAGGTPYPSLPALGENSANGHGPLIRISRAPDWEIPADVDGLRGKDLLDANGERIGVIDDWFYSAAEHRPAIAVVRSGGLFGFLGHEWMVPFDRLEAAGEAYQTRVTRDEIERSPELKDEIYDFSPFYEYWAAPNAPTAPPDEYELKASQEKTEPSAPENAGEKVEAPV